jgi:benzoyl-CoA reductase/2-hydroxyglutaryl-CoA dehydratase subunit BcrC/BadD/HgdB
MMLQYFTGLASGLEAAIAAGGREAGARKRYALEVARLGMRLYSGEHAVAWCGVTVPFDLLHAAGVTSCFVEFVGAILGSMGQVEPFLEEAESRGYATDVCAYHRAVNGALAQGLMPEPAFLIATTSPCSGGLSTVENVARHFGRDLFVLNVPWGDDPGSVAYLAGQLREMMAFVAAHTGPLDPAALREAIETSNRTRQVLSEVYRLARHVPTPARRNDLVNFAYVVGLLLGTRAGEDLATAYRDEFAARVAAGRAGVPGERVRLLWFQNRIQFRNPLAEVLEELGAAVVVDEMNDVYGPPLDPDRPYESLAERTVAIPLCGTAPRRIANLVRLVREYRADGVIHPCHWGCRQGTGARGLIEEALGREGIPVLNLEVDCLDPRNFAEGQLRTRLQAFVEMLAARKGSG